MTEARQVEERLRNAIRDCVNPTVIYDHKILNGPEDQIALPADRAVIAVEIPMGADPPYVHSDGKIYRRVADAAAPKAETDRAALDNLWRRRNAARKRLRRLVRRRPPVSKSESDNPFLHVFISSDPLQQSGRVFCARFERFVELMKMAPVPFDNAFSNSAGFVARQVRDNDKFLRAFTWEFDVRGHSLVTIPINSIRAESEEELAWFFEGYDNNARFLEILRDHGIDHSRHAILDLNVAFAALNGICSRHRALVHEEGALGPHYAKMNLENVWRCVPFLDTRGYMQHLEAHGVPVVQDDGGPTPPGETLESFVQLDEFSLNDFSDGHPVLDNCIADAARMLLPMLGALGIPPTAVVASSKEMAAPYRGRLKCSGDGVPNERAGTRRRSVPRCCAVLRLRGFPSSPPRRTLGSS
ncbi:MAG: hypothetical protein U0263_40510 [Polyangiaceae bacterium]